VPRPRLTYKQALAWLFGLQRFGIKLGLENTYRLLDKLGLRYDLLDPAWAARAAAEISGPMKTSGASGSPTRRPRRSATSLATSASATRG